MGRIRRALGGLLKIIKIIVCAIGIILLLVILWPVVMAVISVVTSIIPGVIAAVNWLVGLVMKVIKPVLDLLKPAFDALKSVYDNWVKPVLTKVQGTVDLVRDNVYKVYNLTIGGVTQTYNNLFGWVDGLQTQFNGFADRVIGMVSVVDQKAADRLDAMRGDVNRTIDKYSSDLFDKVITKINETAGPILTKVDEFAAAVNEKLQHALDLGEKASNYADTLARTSEAMPETTGPVVLYTEERSDQAYEDFQEEAAKPTPPPPPKKTVWDAMFEGWIPFVEEGIISLMKDAEKTIDANIEEIYKDSCNFVTLFSKDVDALKEGEAYDDLVRVLIGDMSIIEYIRVHWKEIVKGMIWGQGKELTPQDDDYWAKRYDELRKRGVEKKKAMIQVDSERWALGMPPMFAKEK